MLFLKSYYAFKRFNGVIDVVEGISEVVYLAELILIYQVLNKKQIEVDNQGKEFIAEDAFLFINVLAADLFILAKDCRFGSR